MSEFSKFNRQKITDIISIWLNKVISEIKVKVISHFCLSFVVIILNFKWVCQLIFKPIDKNLDFFCADIIPLYSNNRKSLARILERSI